MNRKQLVTLLRSAEVGTHLVPSPWTPAQVLDLWDEAVERRDRKRFTVSACTSGRAVSVTIRRRAPNRRPWFSPAAASALATAVAAGIVLAAVALALLEYHDVEPMAPEVIDNEMRHECVRRLGEDCKL